MPPWQGPPASGSSRRETWRWKQGSAGGITSAGDGSGRLFITLQGGKIVIHDGTQVLATPFLDVSGLVACCGEQGLLGLAFHPLYASNRRFFVFYTSGVNGDLVVAEYTRSAANANLADPASARILVTSPHPGFANHNSGQLQFGNDGYLYITMGDGGGGGDPANNAQNLGVLLGKMLRIDVDHVEDGLPYAIPEGNPFKHTAGARGEIWDYGLRNAWRFSFDRPTGDLFIADVGQGAWEEIDYEPAPSTGGVNYGWRLMEGSHCFNPGTNCNPGTLRLPVLEYSHGLGCSVTGGYRYRGRKLPGLHGTYLYADYCSGRIWAGSQDGAGQWSSVQLLDSPYNVSTFGQDEAGELYLADLATGTVYRLTEQLQAASLVADVTFPVIVGTPVTWTATATGGGASGLEYRFWRYDPAPQVWTMVRDYAASSTFVWTPTLAEVGQHAFAFWVRRAGSSADWEAYLGTASFMIVGSLPPSVTSLTADVTFPVTAGTTARWTAVAAGTGPFEYRFFRWDPTPGVWTMVRDYATASTFDWTPTSAEVGPHAFAFWVRRVGSAASWEAYLGTPDFTVTGPQPPAAQSLTADVTFPVAVGTPVTWTAVATGSGSLEYRFWRWNPMPAPGTWTMVRDYAASNTFVWTPGAGEAGQHAFGFWVRRVGSGTDWDAYLGTSTFTITGP